MRTLSVQFQPRRSSELNPGRISELMLRIALDTDVRTFSIERSHARLMNTSAQVGGLLSSVAYGYIVDRFHSYAAPFVPMAALLGLGALLWLKIDASKELSTPQATP